MHRSHRLSIAAALALVAVVVYASPALAGTTLSGPPAKWDAVDVTLILDESPAILMVAGTLPASVALPAKGQLVAPKAAQPQWLGQILGGDASADPSLDTTITQQGDYTVYPFTLTNSRTAQLETLLENATKAEGDNLRASITWPSPQDAGEVRLSFRLPKSAKIIEAADGATMVTTDPTANFYTRTFRDVKAGKPVTLTMVYNVPSLVSDSGGGLQSSTIVLIVGGALAVAAILLAVVLTKSRRVGVPSDEDAYAADGDAAEAPEPIADDPFGDA